MVARVGIAQWYMGVRGNLAGGQGHCLYSAALAQGEVRPYVNGNAALQVGNHTLGSTIGNVAFMRKAVSMRRLCGSWLAKKEV